jgi:hypothetical protein
VLDSSCAGESSQAHLRLRENRRLPSSEAQVTRQHELTAGGSHPTLDLRDADETAHAQAPEEET